MRRRRSPARPGRRSLRHRFLRPCRPFSHSVHSLAGLALALSLAASFVAAAGCRSAAAPPRAAFRAGLVAAPQSAHARPDPFAGQPDAVLAGSKLFARHCAACHGRDARGGRRGPPLDSWPIREAPPGDLFWLLTNGNLRRGMPAWSRLPEAQRWQLVTFVKDQAARAPQP